MLRVTIFREGDTITGFNILGHANSAPVGEDLVCAAVSILAQSTLIGLQSVVEIPLTSVVNKGDMSVFLDPDCIYKAKYWKAQTLLQTFANTMQVLIMSDDYKKYIELIEGGAYED